MSFTETRGRDRANRLRAEKARQRKEWAVTQYTAGRSIEEIAEELEVAYLTARGYITGMGVYIQPVHIKEKCERPKLSNFQRHVLLKNWKRPTGIDHAISEVVHLTRRVTDNEWNCAPPSGNAPHGFVPRRDDQPRVTSFWDLLRGFSANSQEVVG